MKSGIYTQKPCIYMSGGCPRCCVLVGGRLGGGNVRWVVSIRYRFLWSPRRAAGRISGGHRQIMKDRFPVPLLRPMRVSCRPTKRCDIETVTSRPGGHLLPVARSLSPRWWVYEMRKCNTILMFWDAVRVYSSHMTNRFGGQTMAVVSIVNRQRHTSSR